MSTASQERNSQVDELVIEGFYLPSEDLTVRIADRIESLELEAMPGLRIKEESDVPEPEADDSVYLSNSEVSSSSDTSAEILYQRRLLAEELDTGLADWAERPEAVRGEKLKIQIVVTESMADSLGLAASDGLLWELSTEFQSWIDEVGSFTAGWGEIISASEGYMYLAAFEDTEDDSGEPTTRFTQDFPSTKPRSKGVFARVTAMLGMGSMF
jgi:hypothetical protein